MKIARNFPRPVREIENLWIPLSDGTVVAARIWLPSDAEQDAVPAVLEYLPYRKRDGTIFRDEEIYPYLAGQGYACLRVDIRGTGESDGVIRDEYTSQEHQDCLEVLRWIAAQSWCTGAIGMIGISWSGFNSLQMAALRPPELKAIVTLCSTDDRYADDIHYMGGLMLTENPAWSSLMFSYNPLPPDPLLTGERWREMWRERLEANRPWIETWARHQRRDAYWKHGSICEDYSRIDIPVYAIGGWEDGYSNAIPRLLANLKCPRKGLIGPWSHAYPHHAAPGPAIGFLQELTRWWDHWLKGDDTGIMDEPMLRAWMQESTPPRPVYDEHPGRWVAESAWPSPQIEGKVYVLTPEGLETDDTGSEAALHFRSPQTTGTESGRWCGYGTDPDMPPDQRSEDGKSLTFDSAPLSERMEILGAPAVTLSLASDRPQAFVAVRLCDVGPDGTSKRVTFGLLNLTHRHSHELPSPLEPGKLYTVRIQLNDIAHAFPPGHRIRIAISNSYWPMVFPSPSETLLTLQTGASKLELPLRRPRAEDEHLPPFDMPESAPPLDYDELRPADASRHIEDDVASGQRTITLTKDYGAQTIRAYDLTVDSRTVEVYSIREGDPLSARVEVTWDIGMARGDWSVRIKTASRMSCTATDFILESDIEAYEGGRRIHSRNWRDRVPRDLM